MWLGVCTVNARPSGVTVYEVVAEFTPRATNASEGQRGRRLALNTVGVNNILVVQVGFMSNLGFEIFPQCDTVCILVSACACACAGWPGWLRGSSLRARIVSETEPLSHVCASCVQNTLWDAQPSVASLYADNSNGAFVLDKATSTVVKVQIGL
jgi:hypothetical protein